ncbi:signal recognition particle protein [Candidatus Poribacteria bacterium]|nr:signal recognition particle protein [Candidatus Poribacteria bacterium]
MFESLTEKLQNTFRRIRGQGRLTEKNINDALREVRLALLEADVNYKVVRDFINKVKEKAIGQEVMRSLTPDMLIMKIINDELTQLMGGEVERLRVNPNGTTIIMLVGLQGSGKTTAAAKLARKFKSEGKRPLLVAADVYRPAAIKQLQVLGDQIDVPTFSMGTAMKPEDICEAAVRHARNNGYDFVIIDTAGRLHINEELMQELERIKERIQPHEILLVADAMTGQDAVNVAKEFDERLDITGVMLTKLDGDARGGAALSIKAITGKPIKLAGVGEKLDALEEFHPDRMASRILGRGDLLTLVEKAERAIDEEKAKQLEKKLIEKRELDFEDMLEQIRQIKRMGTLDQLIDMIPGLGRLKGKGLQADEEQLKKAEAIINSMTPQERRNYRIINGSRKLRIARGSGTSVRDVNRLIQQLIQTNKLVKQLTGVRSKKARRKMKNLFPFTM